jgi:hypothetical protein
MVATMKQQRPTVFGQGAPDADVFAQIHKARHLQHRIERAGGPPDHLKAKYHQAVGQVDAAEIQLRKGGVGFIPQLVTALSVLALIATMVAVRAANNVQTVVDEEAAGLVRSISKGLKWVLAATVGLVAIPAITWAVRASK